MATAALGRVRTLDLIRGVAVLGILAVNIATFAAPYSWSFTPNLPGPGSTADRIAYAVTLIVFEGKMRALFSMLFGASLALFVNTREARGLSGESLQVRRLLWLALFGLLHFALFWDGDILFLYACVGLGALWLRKGPPAALVIVAIGTFTLWQAYGVASWMPSVAREARVIAGVASDQERQEHAAINLEDRRADRADFTASLGSYRGEVASRLIAHPDYPLAMVANNWGETLSYMLIGMVLLGSGLFSGLWSRRSLWVFSLATLLPGLALTLAFAFWAESHGYPELMMHLALGYGLGFPHLLMALGYAGLFALGAPRLLQTGLGKRLEAAGRTAFSNYLGCTVVMCAIFYGWGAGQFDKFGESGQWVIVIAVWALMLIWSKWWLARFRQGPLEWLWRSLTEWQRLPLRR